MTDRVKSCFKILQNQLQLHDNCHCHAQPQFNSTQSQLKLLSLALLNSSLFSLFATIDILTSRKTPVTLILVAVSPTTTWLVGYQTMLHVLYEAPMRQVDAFGHRPVLNHLHIDWFLASGERFAGNTSDYWLLSGYIPVQTSFVIKH